MAGIYIHIPFCRQKCHYCNFFSAASQKLKEPFLKALATDIRQNSGYLAAESVSTIYFGGGTPSLLSAEEITTILQSITSTFPVTPDAEITLEANPDDLSDAYLSDIRQAGITRLSIGVQSFFDDDLIRLNRTHPASRVHTVLSSLTASVSPFPSFSIDLIYGIPGMTDERWKQNIEIAIGYGIPHISAYALTVEEKTPLAWMIEKGRFPVVSPEQASRQYAIMTETLKNAGYDHYEVSNFCKPGCWSRHNSGYWKNVPYLGTGPSAHSYNGNARRWNVSNISEYINRISHGEKAFEEEILTLTQRYNEYVMTGLRTMWGCDADYIRNEFGLDFFDHFIKNTTRYLAAGRMVINSNGFYSLTDEGMLFADGTAVDFFREDR